ncbi:MAG TPA: hypothetical protein VJ910_07685 [Desulfuromonadales bacterium]|nr:hypothetical protein [Desulfuromonadales bacterium]
MQVGFHLFDSNQKLDETAAFGLSVGYNLTSRWSVELDGRYTPTETDMDSGETGDVDGVGCPPYEYVSPSPPPGQPPIGNHLLCDRSAAGGIAANGCCRFG